MNRKEFLTRMLGTGAILVAGAIVTHGCSESLTGSNLYYVVNSGKCNGCKRCSSSCHYGAISFSSNKAVISKSNCVGCGKCAMVCPQDAISQS